MCLPMREGCCLTDRLSGGGLSSSKAGLLIQIICTAFISSRCVAGSSLEPRYVSYKESRCTRHLKMPIPERKQEEVEIRVIVLDFTVCSLHWGG